MRRGLKHNHEQLCLLLIDGKYGLPDAEGIETNETVTITESVSFS